jgi:capsid portal protein
MEQIQKTPLMPKVVFALKFNAIGLILTLSVLGAGVVQDKLHWGEAMASERTIAKSATVEPDYIDSKAVAVPQDLEPIKIELTDSEKAGLAKCKKTKPADYCGNLWGV